MKKLIEQFYNEGFATTFYKKPIKYVNDKIKNKSLNSFLSIILKIFYTLIIMLFAVFLLYKKLPF